MRTVRRRVMVAAVVALLAGMAMTPQLQQSLREFVRQSARAVQTLALPQETQDEITLPRMTVYAMQLGAYDNGERALAQQKQLAAGGINCVIWQRIQMRLVCDAALRREALRAEAAMGLDAWIIEEELPEIMMRVSAGAQEMDAVRALLTLPDARFAQLCAGEPLAPLIESTRRQAEAALAAHPEHALYAQLAQSLVSWCRLMDDALAVQSEAAAVQYARVTMCTLCYELRQALLSDAAQSAASTASAQRTPSTAADVMPPA